MDEPLNNIFPYLMSNFDNHMLYLDRRNLLRNGQDLPARQMSRSKVISFESCRRTYRVTDRTDTHNQPNDVYGLLVWSVKNYHMRNEMQSEMADFASGTAVWWTGRNTRVVDSSQLTLVSKHNVIHKTGSKQPGIKHGASAIGSVYRKRGEIGLWFLICERTDK